MSDEPTTIDWVLHRTRGHTPTENWNGQGTPVGFNITWHDTADQRWDEEEAHMAECNQWLVRDAPLLREEVIRLRDRIEQAIATLRLQPNDLEDGPDYHRELLSFIDGAICHAIDVLEGKE